MAQLVKNLPAIWETWVQSLGWEDPWEKRKAIEGPQGEVRVCQEMGGGQAAGPQHLPCNSLCTERLILPVHSNKDKGLLGEG